MPHKLKTLFQTMFAVVIVGAMAVSAAQAATPTLVTGTAGTVKAEQVGLLKMTVGGARTAECEVATFTGTSALSQTTLTITPKFEKCKTAPILGVSFFGTVTMNGCDYKFTNLTHNAVAADYNADVSILCPAGKVIELHLYQTSAETSEVCTLTIAEQLDLPGNTITNVAGAPNDLLIHHEVHTAVTRHGSLLCGEEKQTAITEGTITMRALNGSGVQVNLTAITDA